MKLVFFILILSISSTLLSVDRYIVGNLDESTIIGIIIEDKPGEYIVIERDDGEVFALPYSSIDYIRLYIENPIKIVPLELEPSRVMEETPIEIPESDKDIKEDYYGFSSGDLSSKISDLSLYGLNSLELDPWKLKETNLDVKVKVFNDSKKDDVLKFTLLNTIPGLGSIIQGDYYSGVYTLTSVLGAVAYNLASPQGTDLTFIINLNGVIAYLSSFFAPYRYNSKYNNLLKEKLDIAD